MRAGSAGAAAALLQLAAFSLVAAQNDQNSATVLVSTPGTTSTASFSTFSPVRSLISFTTAIPTTTSTPPPPAATTTGISFDPATGYACPVGLLTYYATIQELTGIDDNAAVAYFANFTGAAPGNLINSTGTPDQVGATRTFTASENVTLSEQLIYVNTTSPSGNATAPFLRQRWISLAASMTSPTIYNYTDDLTIYRNSTTGQTNVQLFINYCTDDQNATRSVVSSILLGEIATWYAAISSQNVTGSVTTFGGSSTVVIATTSVHVSSNAGGPIMGTTASSTPSVSPPSTVLLPSGPGIQNITESLPIESAASTTVA